MAQSDSTEAIITPRTNPYFTGHKEAESLLLNAWHSGKIPHAWLISGPKGIGKATLAYRFAKFVLSQAGQEDNLFGLKAENLATDSNHPAVRRVMAGSHGDLLVLEMKDGKEINVEDARKVASFLRLTPSESQWQVVIVDSVDHMNRNAANAILKILEEPPAHTLILLISHLPGKILPTIRSRCRQLRMVPLAEGEFAKVVLHVSPDIGNDAMAKLFYIAKGSPGLAVDMYGSGGLEYYARIVALLGDKPDIPAIHALGEEVGAKGEEQSWQVFATMFSYFFYQLSLQAAGQEREMIVPGEREVIAKMLTKSPLATWLELWEKIRESMEDVTRINLDRKQVMVNAFIGMMR